MQLKLKKVPGTRVILLRHGQSTFNLLELYQGSSDESVLTEQGRKQAQITSNFLQEIEFDAIYSSSLKRARQTVQEILKVITVNPNKIFITDQLQENHLPNWEGLAFEYIRETFPEAYQLWKQRPDEFWMETDNQTRFYPAIDLFARVQAFWQEVLPSHIGKTLLVVAHGGTNRGLISTALGISPQHYHCFQQSNCGISILYFPDSLLTSGQLEVMNLNYHLTFARQNIGEDVRYIF